MDKVWIQKVQISKAQPDWALLFKKCYSNYVNIICIRISINFENQIR